MADLAPAVQEKTMLERAPVSVVIPAYNSEDYIGDAIQSVLAQSLPVAEIIVVDDGSTDRTSEIGKSLGALVIRQANRGVAAARNVGIRAAKNEWIAFIDSDDLWAPEKIECQVAALQLHPDVGVVSCNMTWFADDSIRGSSGLETDVAAALAPQEEDNDGRIGYFQRVKDELPFNRMTDSANTLLIRRDLLLCVGLFDESLRRNDHLECFLRVVAQCPLAIVKKTLVKCRIHRKNTSLSDPEGVTASYYQILDLLHAYPQRYPTGAARAYDQDLSTRLISHGRSLLVNGRMHEARSLFSQSARRSYSGRAICLWFLTFLGPSTFKYLLTVKRKLFGVNSKNETTS